MSDFAEFGGRVEEGECRAEPRVHPSSVLFVTLDSCRYDTFARAHAPNLKSVGPLHKAKAPSYFTFGSHSAMFMGFTPGIARLKQPFLNPKWGKVFRLKAAGFAAKQSDAIALTGANIIEGFAGRGYITLGSAAVGWFDPNTPTGRILGNPFQEFFFAGNTHSIKRQILWLNERLCNADGSPVFAFLNIGETHVPYYYDGAPWSASDNPCVPFQTVDRSLDCAERQAACLEFVDKAVGNLIRQFADASIMICADHGDCWGEDGLWEHGISHEMTLTVPLLLRMDGSPVAEDNPMAGQYETERASQ